ncbi:DMT family transporter [Lentibacter sp. XHP0401]|mgnify:CR=1 FL=1|jgi:drug/metabolite transporter (DMT)-like permease|uniref:DMT family transporter n=1 Tax=Lentibacter sp. XHP0401 TaxID=2984334 RepID=UPI0021E6DBC8|nr:DMT family transporter [Lentibacter sp. XHP0401]MCV2892247.1 DMT family transporter [Lentibacter sp. XHP0401]
MRGDLAGHLAMMCFAALVAGSFALGALIADQVSPLVVTAIRFALTAVLFGVMAWPSLAAHSQEFRAPWRYVVLGGCTALYFILMFEALKTAPAVSLSVEFTLTPLISGVFGYFLLGQLASKRVLFALLVGAVGAIWVIFRGDIAQLLAFRMGRGELIFFIGMAFYALYAPLVRKLKRGEPANAFTFAITLGALVVTLPFAAKGLVQTDYAALSLQVWGVILYLTFFASAATFSLIQFAALRLPSVKVMAHTYLIPSWVIVWQLAMGRGAPTAVDLVGVVLTVLALVLLLKSQG